MECTVSGTAYLHRLELLAARLVRAIGGWGVGGLLLLSMAAVIALLEWRQPRLEAPPPNRRAAPLAQAQAPAASTLRLSLPAREDTALLLTQVQQIAVAQGMVWAAAEYKALPSGEGVAAGIEVRCTLKTPYPRLRQALAQWLRDVPGLAIRDVTINRRTVDAGEVEAKLVIVIFMRDVMATSNGGRP
jgi:hypothetical protein